MEQNSFERQCLSSVDTIDSVYGMYRGSTTNDGTEANWRDKKEICPQSAILRAQMDALVHNIQSNEAEHKKCREKAIIEVSFKSYDNKEKIGMCYGPPSQDALILLQVACQSRVRILIQ